MKTQNKQKKNCNQYVCYGTGSGKTYHVVQWIIAAIEHPESEQKKG